MRSLDTPTLIEFKKALGSEGLDMSDEEIMKLNDVCERMASTLFDNWLKQVSKNSPNDESMRK